MLTRPQVRFPEPGWRTRLREHVERLQASYGADLEVRLGGPSTEARLRKAEKAVGVPLPEELRSLLGELDGARFDFTAVVAADQLSAWTEGLRAWQAPRAGGPMLPDVSPDAVVAIGHDSSDNYYGLRLDGPHRHSIVYFCHDPPGWEHRFTGIGPFLEALLVRAEAAAGWRRAEGAAGKPIDDAPWNRAARALELEIDPGLVRTRED